MTDAYDEVTLAARAYLYRVFHGLLGCEPTAQTLDAVDAALVRQSLEIAGAWDAATDEEAVVLERWCEALSRLGADPSELTRLYNNLFVGPAVPAALPWEAMHTTNARRLFGPVALSVRKAYRAAGCIPAGYPHVSDDALALELDFLAVMAQRAQRQLEEGDAEAADASLRSSGQFLGEHLGAWTSSLWRHVEGYRSGTLYALTARALDCFTRSDRQLCQAQAA